MKYTKIFDTESNYKSFRDGNDWITPNISVTKENISIKYTEKLFPAYLVTGENGKKGIKIYKYLTEKYPSNGATLTSNEQIYIDGNLKSILNSGYILTDGGYFYNLKSDVSIICRSHSGGAA